MTSTVTCRTEGCSNQGQPIDLELTYVDDNGDTQPVDGVSCGVCAQPITDVQGAPDGYSPQ